MKWTSCAGRDGNRAKLSGVGAAFSEEMFSHTRRFGLEHRVAFHYYSDWSFGGDEHCCHVKVQFVWVARLCCEEGIGGENTSILDDPAAMHTNCFGAGHSWSVLDKRWDEIPFEGQ